MDKHLPTHYHRPGWTGDDDRRPCHPWTGPDAFGHDRCNDAAESIIDGLRYSTRTAELIAVNDGEYFGRYLFRTAGGRYFQVRLHWPYTGDRSHPLDVLSQHEAMRAYSDITAQVRYGAAVVPEAEAFPDAVVADA